MMYIPEIKKPQVLILNKTPLGIAEYAGRTAYNSFDKSENSDIKYLNDILKNNDNIEYNGLGVQNVIKKFDKSSKLLIDLAHVYHHYSVLEHINITYLINGISRGVLQELVRHRIASYTVRSTRYTMSDILYAFLIIKFKLISDDMNYLRNVFFKILSNMDLFVLNDSDFIKLETDYIFNGLMLKYQRTGDFKLFQDLILSKEARDVFDNITDIYDAECVINGLKKLSKCKQKKNSGDHFKFIVTDNWKTDLVLTMNLRSLKNFFKLRDSGAAYFQIRMLAKEMKKVLPEDYVKLI